MWVNSLGLILLMQILMFVNGAFEGCDYNYYVDSSRDVVLNSPNYPNKYNSGSSCRYSIKAPLGYEILISCDINLDKSSSGCGSEYFYVSLDADSNLRGANQFCGSGSVARVSEYNKLSFAFVSTSAQGSRIGGKFTCRLSVRAQACDCGWSQRGRIVGGTNAAKTEFPATVGIGERAKNTIFCGGSIISSRTVITAAHCVELIPNRSPSNVFILAGFNSLSTASQSEYANTYLVSKIIEHPNYNPSTEHFDIALMITSTSMEWSRGLAPICLPMDTSSMFNYYNAFIVGWGTTSFGGPRSNTMLKAGVNVVANSDCKTRYSNLLSSQMCTFASGRDSCQFDSGGPVIYKGSMRQYLIGIISYGRQCAGNTPGVNTRVTSFISWIRDNTVDKLCFKPFN